MYMYYIIGHSEKAYQSREEILVGEGQQYVFLAGVYTYIYIHLDLYLLICVIVSSLN